MRNTNGSFRIWTLVAVSTSYNNNHYVPSASIKKIKKLNISWICMFSLHWIWMIVQFIFELYNHSIPTHESYPKTIDHIQTTFFSTLFFHLLSLGSVYQNLLKTLYSQHLPKSESQTCKLWKMLFFIWQIGKNK